MIFKYVSKNFPKVVGGPNPLAPTNLTGEFSMKNILLIVFLSLTSSVFAQSVPVHAEGLHEQLISVDLGSGVKQEGVLSLKVGSKKPTRLAVILPGHPSVVRPVVEGSAMTSSQLSGNFLIRARRYLVNDSVASLIVDCRSDAGEYCSSSYQSSLKRHQDALKLIQEVKKQLPSIEQVWLVGTSMGTVSSAFMPTHEANIYSGAIHTASITEPYSRNSYRELGDFDYKKLNIPQVFIHHRDDPCYLTTYSGAKSISDKYQIPLVTVVGGSGFTGAACKAYTEHGFKGKEKEVMEAIARIMTSGKADQLFID
jgi:hypothetical protein